MFFQRFYHVTQEYNETESKRIKSMEYIGIM